MSINELSRILDLIISARDLLIRDGWCQWEQVCTRSMSVMPNWGEPAQKNNKQRRCLSRAIEDAARGDETLRDAGWHALSIYLNDLPVVGWNDKVGRRLEEVLATLDGLIEKMRLEKEKSII